MLDRLFEMQRALNDGIFEKHDLGLRSADFAREDLDPAVRNEWVLNYTRALQHEVVEAERTTVWKWWSKDKELDVRALRVEVIDCWHFLISLSIAAGMTPADVQRIYEEKWRVNQERQAKGYAKVTKTEDDTHIT
jgi:dimeric dUTPase (all-alpha-NTP-PPase superfamily)